MVLGSLNIIITNKTCKPNKLSHEMVQSNRMPETYQVSYHSLHQSDEENLFLSVGPKSQNTKATNITKRKMTLDQEEKEVS